MNFKLKIVCFMLAIITVLPLVISCNNGGTDAGVGTTSPSDNNGGTDAGVETTSPSYNNDIFDDPNLLYLALDGKTDYVIVHSAKMTESNRIVVACNALSAAIKEKTGVEIPVVTDDMPAAAREIIVGKTERPESLNIINELEKEQFAIRAVGNKIVVRGFTDSITIGALNYFADMTVNSANSETKTISVERTLNATYTGVSGQSDITVMGTPISQFTIVYPSDYTASEKRLAQYLVEHIYDITGAFVRMSRDNSSFDNEILIGNTSRTVASTPEGHTFNVSGKGGKLQLQAGSTFAYYELVTYITEELLAKNRPVFHFTDSFEYSRDVSSTLTDGAQYADSVQGEYRIMVQNIWGNTGENHATRHMMTIELALAYNADILSLQEVDPRNRQGGNYAIDKLLASVGYAEVVPKGITGNNYTPIFYKADKFELVECAYKIFPERYPEIDGSKENFNEGGTKGYTWAVLRDKVTGDIFAVLSTHFWYRHDIPGDDSVRVENAKEVIKALELITEKYGNIAILATGDFNCSCPYAAIQTMLNAGGDKTSVVWAAGSATSTEDIQSNHAYPKYSSDLGTYVSPATPSKGATKSIDHIFVYNSNQATLNRFDVCTDLFSLLTSDHCALFLDFDIK